MLDRRVIVEKVSGESLRINEGDTVHFSELEMIRNIIILGDPGSGKTELLRSRKEIHGGVFTKAANFLNRPIKCEGGDYYIDALDERRTSTNKRAMVDEISGKLWEVQPDNFRLASRKQDWLGDADLEIFLDYFEENGGYIVVSLMPLTDDELIIVLKAHKVESPAQFIDEARAKKLDGLLQNPQNAIMLARAVRRGSWPSTRRDVFTRATEFLLREHNDIKAISGDVNFSAEELRDTAGELCALRLIADLPGYRLHLQGNPEYDGLYYRDVRSEKQELISAALQRPLFRATDENDCLDTVHRTLAEFMAGQWLASRIDTNLPPTRLDALIGREGFPVTALRGLYAWLPVFSRKHCEHYLKADPMGIVTNGDVFSLTLQSKRTLLKSLCDFANRTPWFNTWGEPAEQLKALGVPELKPEIMSLLESKETSDDMRMALLRMISADLARDEEIRTICRTLVLRVDDNFQEAEEALNALCSDWLNNRQWITDFMLKEDKTTGRLRLKSQMISLMPEKDFIPEYLASLLIDSLVLPQQIPLGSFYGLKHKLSTEHSLEILKLLSASLPDEHSYWINASQVYHSISSMVCMLLRDDLFSEDEDLILCLDVLAWFSSSGTYLNDNENILEIIKPYKFRITDWARNKIISGSSDEKKLIKFANELHHKTKGVLDYSLIISILTDAVDSDSVVGIYKENAYIAALTLSLRGGTNCQEEMNILKSMAEKNDDLSRLFERVSFYPVISTDSKIESQNKLQHEKKQYDINALNADIKVTKITGSESAKRELLRQASRIYWGINTYVRNLDFPSERLSHLLLPDNIDYITAEWKKIIICNVFPDFKEIIHVSLESSGHPDSLCLLTAAEVYYEENQTINLLNDNSVRVLLVLELTEQVMCSFENGLKRRAYKFRWLEWIKVNKVSLIIETLIEFLSEIEIKRPSYHFKNFLVRRLLIPEYAEVWPRMLHILRNDVENSLEVLCAILRTNHDFSGLKRIMHEIVNGEHPISDESHDMWNAVLFITGSSDQCEPYINSVLSRPESAFYLQDLAGLGKYGQQQTVILSAERIQNLLSVLIPCFPEREIRVYDVVVTSEHSREHDGEHFISRLIALLAADSSAHASLCLVRLVDQHNQSSWSEDLRQARQTQLRRRRDAEYTQLSWIEVKETLHNLQPANAADLHALLCEFITLTAMNIRQSNTDSWKLFWNEGSHGSVDTPKSENSCTDALITLLSPHLQALNVRLEPEMHMARDKRADIGATYSDRLKISVEVKRHYHSQVWTATEKQLKKLYVPDPQSDGYGIFLVFWFGEKCKTEMPLHPIRRERPGSASEMELWLNESLATEDRYRIKCFVIDVSFIV
ncbi:hypothetical protein [Pantoea stewartii]|uniref:hypothetical protein n=1 Tax=Pantoea stewartii TaxID=66269 RepID=UPI00345C5D8C